MSLPSEVMSRLENTFEMMNLATDRQASELSRFMASNRFLTRDIFPDRFEGEDNMWRSDCESWVKKQDRRIISDIISMLHDDQIAMALMQLIYLK